MVERGAYERQLLRVFFSIKGIHILYHILCLNPFLYVRLTSILKKDRPDIGQCFPCPSASYGAEKPLSSIISKTVQIIDSEIPIKDKVAVSDTFCKHKLTKKSRFVQLNTRSLTQKPFEMSNILG